MAVGPFTIFDRAMPKLTNGIIDLDTHTFRAILCSNAQALAATFAGTSTDCRKADLTGEFTTGGGYTANGIALSSVTLSRTADVVVFDADNLLWSALTLANLCYLVVFDDSAANEDLLGFVEVNVGGTISPAGVDLSVVWDAADGIFRYRRP